MNRPCGRAVLCGVAAAAMMVGSAWAHVPGRMTGGGSFFCPYLNGFQRVTHGFQLHCGTGETFEGSDPAEPNNLEINFSGGDNFHLTTLTKGLCSDSGGIEEPPSADFDTFVGEGTGTFNGQPASITFTFTDGGEPGTDDTALVVITPVGSTTPALKCDQATRLTFGNHQAHKATGSKK